jgi:hypothetical protein
MISESLLQLNVECLGEFFLSEGKKASSLDMDLRITKPEDEDRV